MAPLETLLINFSETHRLLSYLIIVLAVLIEGEVILLLAGVLSRNGYLDIFDVMVVAFAAAIIHDIVYWLIGKRFSKITKKRFLFVNFDKIQTFLEKTEVYNGFYIFISKFAWNFNRIVLIASGYLKIPIKRVLYYSAPACFIWAIVFVSLGYIFAYKTDILHKSLETAALFLTGFIAIIVFLENIFRKILKKKHQD
jgi:membrane protein DedA with SNARE-associated domain